MACTRNGKGADRNVLLITVDSLRADRLGYGGHAGARTPVIDALAARGTVFARAFTPVPEATPAIASVMTGLYPARHRLRSAFGGALGPTQNLPDGVPFLPALLKEAGYRTGAVASSLMLHRKYGLSRGFDSYQASFQEVGRPSDSAEIGVPAQKAADLALEFLEGSRGSPFFLWVNFHDPHYFYVPPEPFASEFKDRPYDGEVAYVDREIGRIFARLSEYGLEAETVVVFAGSNGEGLGDHGEDYHGVTLQNATTRVPLIVAAPGSAALPPGKRIDAPVSLVDIAPTLFDALGLDPLPSVDGVRLTSSPVARTLYFEATLPAGLFGWSRLIGALEGNLKYVAGARAELFDLDADPGETVNLAGSQPEQAGRLSRMVSAYDESRPAAPPQAFLSRIKDLGYRTEPREREVADPRDRVAVANDVLRADRSLRRRALQPAYRLLHGVLIEDRDNFLGLVDAAVMSRGARDTAGSLALLQNAQELYPASSEVYHQLGHTIQMADPNAGDRPLHHYALAADLDPLNEESLYDLACAYAAKGDTAKAIARLEQAVKAGFRDFEWMAKDPDLDSLRSHPRFDTITEGRARKKEAGSAAAGEP